MRKPFKIFFAFLLIIGVGSCSVKSAKVGDNAAQTKVFQMLLDSICLEHPDAVGLMVHIEAPDQNISWSGISVPPMKTSEPLPTADLPALIASNTKTYVSTAMLRLVEQKKVVLDQTIGSLLTDKTSTLLKEDGYDLDKITLAHLLSHTSGIFDYVEAELFFAMVNSDPKHRWSREEQIALAISGGAPLGPPGSVFSYADTNYLLLTEIMEQLTDQAFYTAIRNLINYKKHGLDNTWFTTLEEAPPGSKKPVYQSIGSMDINSYELDHSFDLYGGGGIMSTTKDLARFSQLLFNKKLFDKDETLNLIFTQMPTDDGKDNQYYLGLSESKINGLPAFGHGGFWATVVQYLPDLNASIAVFVLERDQRILRQDVLKAMVGNLKSRKKR